MIHTPSGSFWLVVGGSDKGGILVREGIDLSSKQYEERLRYGAVVEEVEIVGERLHFRRPTNLLSSFAAQINTGPEEGWISMKLKGKNLVVPLMPNWKPEQMPEKVDAKLTFYAISDVHVELKANMTWLESLPYFERSVVLVAGDLGTNLVQVQAALEIFKKKFQHVFYCFGNHDTWVSKARSGPETEIGSYNDSFEKLDRLRELCNKMDVKTTPTLLENVWVVPVLGWYHSSWDTEPTLQPPAGKQLSREILPGEEWATDSMACKWKSWKNGSKELAQVLDEQNEKWGCWPLPDALLENLKVTKEERAHRVISFSHFLPRIELLPEKRFLFQPSMMQIVGSDYVRARISQVNPDVHIFGHTHFPWDMTLNDGVRYMSWPLGTPEEQSRRVQSYPTEHTQNWHPLPIFDTNGWQPLADEACWFSWMYSRIPRNPKSSEMASYVRMTFCPDAPQVPDTICSHGFWFKPQTEENRSRREASESQSMKSMKKEVKRSSNGQASWDPKA